MYFMAASFQLRFLCDLLCIILLFSFGGYLGSLLTLLVFSVFGLSDLIA